MLRKRKALGQTENNEEYPPRLPLLAVNHAAHS
jgi:hypothetical protein